MTDLTFTIVDVTAEQFSVTPRLTARIRIAAGDDEPIQAIALRCQIRIEPLRRPYSDEEAEGLVDLFGPRQRWVNTQRTFLWQHSTAMVQGFTGVTEISMPLECTYDFEVAASKYLHALRDGAIPLLFLFSGTVFVQGERGFSVRQVSWECEAQHEMPVSEWSDLIRHALSERRLGAARARHRRPRLPPTSRPAGCSTSRTRSPRCWPRRRASHPASRAGAGAMTATWDRARAIADAVLYEGYLLYPYRATSSKNQSRWQFGVLGPPGASAAGVGEDDTLSSQFLIDGDGELTLVVRFLQLQHRRAERDVGGGRFEPVDELTSGLQSWVTWDEAVECELPFGPFGLGRTAHRAGHRRLGR